jgi:23S rRNA (adenine-N6)-dimethyltransferase
MSSSMSSSPRPSIAYAQNFLRNRSLVASLLDVCYLDRESTVYEIGPGKGIITEQLAERHWKVVAIEKDPYLAELLRRRFAEAPNVTIHCGDFLRYRLPRQRYHVVANIPFNSTSAIVAHLTESAYPPEVAHLVMQREAAETLMGWPHQSLRTLYLQPWFEVEITHRFRRTDFWPVPRVDVVMLRLRKRGPPLIRRHNGHAFRDFVACLFTAWQPTVPQSLRRVVTGRQLVKLRDQVSFDMNVIPTSMTLEQWLELFAAFQLVAGERGKAATAGSEGRLLQQQSRLQKTHRTRTRR